MYRLLGVETQASSCGAVCVVGYVLRPLIDVWRQQGRGIHPRLWVLISLHAAERAGVLGHLTWADDIALASEKTEDLQSIGNELNASVQRAGLRLAPHKLRLGSSRCPATICVACITHYADDDLTVLWMSVIMGGPARLRQGLVGAFPAQAPPHVELPTVQDKVGAMDALCRPRPRPSLRELGMHIGPHDCQPG